MHACQIDRNFYQHPNKEDNGPSLFIGLFFQGHAQQANTCALSFLIQKPPAGTKICVFNAGVSKGLL